jgi:histidyl-tRNA synthetase
MIQKPSIPKGTRDFSPAEMAGREYIFETVKLVFRLYGYLPIETPAMETLGTLLGKYGEEGDKLIFKVLNSGDAFSSVTPSMLENSNSLSLRVCEKGLRYDLTVPFARYVVQHQNEIVFPFKRFQIQPVWRADRPQKGRYREFYQCDVDVIGSRSLLNELELIQIVNDVFGRLNIDVLIKINNRKVLSGIAEVAGCPDKLTDITVAIDKIDKIGLEQVKQEMADKGLNQKTLDIIEPVLMLKGSFREKLLVMRKLLQNSETGIKGLDELEELLGLSEIAGVDKDLELDLSLARGLSYYTGAIFEVKAVGVEMGSICGGGRYDDLTGVFGLPDMPGVGISFGADRIYDVLTLLDRFPEGAVGGTKVMFANLGDESVKYLLPLMSLLRDLGVACDLYPGNVKLKKQFDYASKRAVQYIVIAGEEEIGAGTLNLKNLITGEQVTLTENGLADFFKRQDK